MDGFDEVNNTVYIFHGCLWLGYPCHLKAKKKRSDQAIRDADYNLVTITSCEWLKMPESKMWYRFKNGEQDEMEEISAEDKQKQLLDDNRRDNIFKFVKCDIRVPDHLIEQFSEYPPNFKNFPMEIKTLVKQCKPIAKILEGKLM